MSLSKGAKRFRINMLILAIEALLPFLLLLRSIMVTQTLAGLLPQSWFWVLFIWWCSNENQKTNYDS